MIIVDSFNHWGVSFAFEPQTYPCQTVYRYLRPHDSTNYKTAKFFRENKGPEGKRVEFLFLWQLQKNPYILMRMNENNSAAKIPCSHVRYIEVR